MIFDKKWFCHKFKGTGFRYKVHLCIVTDHIVWVLSLFEHGAYPYIQITRLGILHLLQENNQSIADSNYRGEPQTHA